MDAALERDGLCALTADELKLHGGREPRLMAKVDTLAERPAPLAERGLALFPTRNGRYVLFPDPAQKSFHRFPEGASAGPARVHRSLRDLAAFDTFPRGREWSESQALDFAHLSGLLSAFCGAGDLHLTLRGRCFSGDFAFPTPLGGRRVEVSRVQMELDAGYEGEDALVLVEAKRGARSDFHVRQLWYPWLHWRGLTRKRLVPLFVTWSNGRFTLTEFAFGEGFGELEAVRSRAYLLDESPLAEIDLPSLLAAAAQAEPAPPSRPGEEAVLPQANDLDKVVDLVQLAAVEAMPKARIAEAFGFDERQGDYYGNAGVYLGLLQRGGGGFEATAAGSDFAALRSRAERTAALVARMAARPALRGALELLVIRGYRAEKIAPAELAGLVREGSALGASTPARRASTLRAWLGWVMENIRVRVA